MNQCQADALICWPFSFADLRVSYICPTTAVSNPTYSSPVRGSSWSNVRNGYAYTAMMRVISLHLGSAVARYLHESSERVCQYSKIHLSTLHLGTAVTSRERASDHPAGFVVSHRERPYARARYYRQDISRLGRNKLPASYRPYFSLSLITAPRIQW